MKPIQLALASFCFVILFASMGQGGVQRTFVSGLGNDGNPCSRTAPCRTFAQAISQTNSSGEIYVLDSAGYAAFTITTPVSIVAPPGVTAGISVFTGENGITINAGASDIVILRGLTVNNQGSMGSGIVFNTGGTLHVENCVVNGFSATNSAGVLFQGPGKLEVKDSIMRGNDSGIFVQPVTGPAVATIDQVRLEGGTAGLFVHENSTVTVRNSVASLNTGDGFFAVSVTSSAVELNIETCVVSNNNVGILTESLSTGVATVRLSNSTVTGNALGLANFGSPAVLLSRGNNTVEGNGTNTSGTIGSYSAK